MSEQFDGAEKTSRTFRLRADVFAFIEELGKLAEFGDNTAVIETLVSRKATECGLAWRNGRVVKPRNGVKC